MKPPESPKRMRTWRDIPQNVTPRAMSRAGRRRQWMRRLRWAGFGVGLIALCGGVLFVARLMAEGDLQLARASNAEPVREVVLRTDGVLDQAWIMRRLALAADATLIDLDLAMLRERLLADRQVITATLTRKFPATLEVSLSERSPVARINVRSGGAGSAPRPQLVARDGVVYPGNGYDAHFLAELPWLGGVKLRRVTEVASFAAADFAPIFGMPLVAELLATARNEAPALYKTWRVVSLARLESDAEIEVKTDTIDRIIFNARESAGFLRQVAQLDLLLDSVQPNAGAISEINLAIGRMVDGRIQVPVTFKDDGTGGGAGRHRNAELIAPVPPRRQINPNGRAGSDRAPSPAFFHPTRPSAREF